MKLNIIHLAHRKDRLALLNNELHVQGITDYRIWEGIVKPDIKEGIAEAHKK